MANIILEPISANAFAPFGQLLPLGHGQTRVELIDELHNGRDSARPRLSVVEVPPTTFPLMVAEMERHIFSSQVFMPCYGESYMVLVAQHGDDDLPDLATLRAFRVPTHFGIHYHPDTWHYPITACGQPARFVVLTFINGTRTDEQFVPLSEAITVIDERGNAIRQ
ncbi:hypothetical protein ED28_16080 [[Pantoea] beijingensis]|uniref:Ureidoglycolate hydrolase n=1 Tax=[Pantoea] beijingensis TaxID=1324864 RepID=A0A443IAN1_9GAMM|nr:ureidoglycolate lyase [[Pantoea] beijingensis]RWR00966.1 hypothetical protein ED28_16080 [[Pantoea] beijingensis]